MVSSRIADHVGRVLGGRYRLLAPVGTGASAHVFVADDVVLRRRVAVKVLHAALAEDEAFLRRFRAEARSAAGLNHPNIMRVFDWGEDDDGPFLVLEFLGGGSLRDLLDQGNRLSPSQAALVGVEAARALDYAHRRGIVHRDIKPANLLFDDEGRLCIADFGLARALAEAAATEPLGALVGTVRYASPEQARGASVDGRGDVYALALVLVEAASGQVPFASDTAIATLMARTESPLPVPNELGPLVPALAAAGTIDPDQRLDAATLVSRLTEVARELPAPERLPLAGTAPLDASRAVDSDPTQMPPVRPRLFDNEKAGAFDDLDDQEEILPIPLTGGRVKIKRRHSRARRRRWPLVTVLALVVALLLGGGVAVATGVFVPSHPVPNLRDDTIDQARAALAAPKFKLSVAHAFDESVAKGKIIKTDPPANAKLKEHRTVKATVSDGPKPRTVPDLRNTLLPAAQQKLGDVGLTATLVRVFSEDIQKDAVISWKPGTGTTLDRGQSVELTVSNGPQPRTISDWRGQTYDVVAQHLTEAGLKPARKDVFDDSMPVGQVVSTTPAAGSQVPKGSTVTVNVSKGPDLVAVPTVVGLRRSDAVQTLQQVGLTAVVYGPNGGNKIVFQSSPQAGTQVKRGSQVALYVM
ncbi:MAG TPA: PASTA domain-containing protein [Acidimicrobiales bacterium]|nr:PASTA domain-containing protein [Acidimicrobiales bacterium]